MTRDQLLDRLLALASPTLFVHERDWPDREQRHIDADEALLLFIDDPDITAAFNQIEKWYS